MSGFFHTITSDGSKDIHPDNHGGDCTVELYEELHLPGKWEVALVEMSYFGQYFPNVMYEDSGITISSKITYKNSEPYVLGYNDASEVFIDYYAMVYGAGPKISFIERRRMPKRNYTWQEFKNVLPNYLSHRYTLERWKYHLYVWINDYNMLCLEPDVHCQLTIYPSEAMKKLLSITNSYNYFWENTKQEIHITRPKDIEDTSFVIFSPFITEPLWIEVDDTHKIEIPNLLWTMDTINPYLKKAVKEYFEKTDNETQERYLIHLHFIFVYDKEYHTSPLWLKIEYHHIRVKIRFSPFLEKMLHITGPLNIKELLTTYPVYYDIVHNRTMTHCKTFQLPQNYYASPSELITSLNNECVEYIRSVIKQQLSAQTVDVAFSLKERDICSYTSVPNFEIGLSPFLFRLLKLPTLKNSCVGTSPIILESAVRPYLYVECNLVAPHFFNQDVRPLLRIINNTAKENERALVTFTHLQYYPLARSYFSNIHITITDNVLGTLVFAKPITYLLHFRPCLPSM